MAALTSKCDTMLLSHFLLKGLCNPWSFHKQGCMSPGVGRKRAVNYHSGFATAGVHGVLLNRGGLTLPRKVPFKGNDITQG